MGKNEQSNYSRVIAIMPMKGHSERVSGKNIRPFGGRPLYHCIAETLQNIECIESIVINTDSDFIADDAIKHFSKVKIITRPDKLRGDFVPMNDIIAHDLAMTAGEHFLQTHSTNPLLKGETVERAIESYFSSLEKHDSVYSVTRLQTRLYWPSGEPINHDPSELIRTQDLSPVYEENSNFYLFSKSSFSGAGNTRIGLRPSMFPVDKLEAIDIDEEEDFKLAEILYKMGDEGMQNVAEA